MATVLPSKPDEAAVVGVDTVEMPVVAMFPPGRPRRAAR